MADLIEVLNASPYPVSRETVDALLAYQSLLLKWQARINLIGPDTIPHLAERHFLDSIQLRPLLPSKAKRVLDIGSGAGFPGLVLALLNVPEVHLVESDARKAVFLREAARIMGAHVQIHHARIESLELGLMDVVVSRACSRLDTLLEYSYPSVSHETHCLFPKGRNYSKEIESAQADWEFGIKIHPSLIDSESVILELTHVKRRGNDTGEKQANTNLRGSEPEGRGG